MWPHDNLATTEESLDCSSLKYKYEYKYKYQVLQCDSNKSPPRLCDLRFSDIFSQMVENFKLVFYTPITRSYLR